MTKYHTTSRYQDILPSGIFLGFWVLGQFGSKSQKRKIVKINKNSELYEVFWNNFMCQNVLIFPIYIIQKENEQILV